MVYGAQYRNEVINLDVLVKKGTIAPDDLKLFHFADTPEDAFAVLRDSLTRNHLRGKKPKPGGLDDLMDVYSEMSLRPEIAKTRP